MNTLSEIERAISALSPSELDELYTWMDQNCPIDVQLKTDLNAGRIDERIASALADHKAGNTRPLEYHPKIQPLPANQAGTASRAVTMAKTNAPSPRRGVGRSSL